jgi:signal peptidase I
MKTPSDRDGMFREVSRQMLGDGYAVRFRAIGASMEPAIADGDMITVAPVAADEVKLGDVVFCASGQRRIAHRVVEIHATAPGPPVFIVRGDARAECDPPVGAGQILGKIISVERPGARSWAFWRRRIQRLLVMTRRDGTRPQPPRTAAQDPPDV